MAGSAGRVVVVGGSMGGLRAAEGVCKAGYTGEVVVVGDETRMPYNRPPLSKDALAGTTDVDTLTFRVPRAAADVQWRLGESVVSADLSARTVTLSDELGARVGRSGHRHGSAPPPPADPWSDRGAARDPHGRGRAQRFRR